MPLDDLLTLKFKGGQVLPPDEREKRRYISITSMAFIINHLESQYVQLEANFKASMELNYREVAHRTPRAMRVSFDRFHGDKIACQAWNFIDWADRLRKQIGSVNGVKKNEPWLKDFADGMTLVKAMRDKIQHFDGTLSKFVDDSFPLMGTTYAYFGLPGDQWCGLILPTSPLRAPQDTDVNIHGIKFPDTLKSEVDGIGFSLGEESVNISDVMRCVRSGREKLQAHLLINYEEGWPSVGASRETIQFTAE